MSAGTDPRSNAQVIEQERRRLSQRLDEVARLCEGTLGPSSFYAELLQRLVESLAAVAGSVWIRNSQGHLVQQFQINMQQVGLDSEDARKTHDTLLRFAFTNPQNIHLPPRSGVGQVEDGKTAPGNPTQYMLLMVPIKQNEQVVGLIEIFQGANRPAAAVPGFLQYMALMADLAGRYQRNQLVGQLSGQQQLWSQLESFARNVHSSLNPTEVAFHVANEGRRLVECDRISVATRRGGLKTQIEAVSGCDTVEKRSNQVRLMRVLADHVLTWGERLVYSGTKDDSLPPKVLHALDAYLAETPSKLLVIQPLRDDREVEEKDKHKPKPKPRAALVMECFESPDEVQQTMARLDVVSRHATSALNNAIEHHRIPMRWMWMPLAKLQEGLGGKTKAITMAVIAGLSTLIAGLIIIPYPLKVEAGGKALPAVRRSIFTSIPGQIRAYEVRADDEVNEGRSLVQMYDSTLFNKINELDKQIQGAEAEKRTALNQAKEEFNPAEKANLEGRAALKEIDARTKRAELEELIKRTSADKHNPGRFSLVAPAMTPEEKRQVDRSTWYILNSNFRETHQIDQLIQPSEPIIRLGAKDGQWELEMKIPQKHVGQVLRAFGKKGKDKDLDVEFILTGDATSKFKGKLAYHKLAGEAVPDPEANTGQDPEPVVIAYVRIDGDDIEKAYRIPRERLMSSGGVKAKVVCGDYASGYSLFYGVWEFVYEKVVFFFF